jgi:hypothetical protein
MREFEDDLMDLVIEEGDGNDDCVCGHVRDEHTEEARDCMMEGCECIQFDNP